MLSALSAPVSSAFLAATLLETSVVEKVDCFSMDSRMPSLPLNLVKVSALLSVISTVATSMRRTSSTESLPTWNSFMVFSSSSDANLSPTRTRYWFSDTS